MISAAAQAHQTFSEKDAIFIAGGAELEFLGSHTNPSLYEALLIPVSFDGLGSALRSGHPKIFHYLPLVDFDRCRSSYTSLQAKSRTWLSELGLKFEVDDVDIVSLDAPSQYLLFAEASYLESLVTRILKKLPAIETFYIFTSEDPLPMDFYFDSDTAAGVLQYVCERAGRKFKTIALSERRLKFPQYLERPILGRTMGVHTKPSQSAQGADSNFTVGMAPGGVVNFGFVAAEIHQLEQQSVVFQSSWNMELNVGKLPGQQVIDLASYAEPPHPEIEERLQQIWIDFLQRRSRSTLSDAIVLNSYLEFQLHYVITRRWLRLAALVLAARKVARQIPLKLFVCCELCHDEGAILARAYRDAGASVLVLPHSGWPCDPVWTDWKSSDSAVTRSRSAAKRVVQLTGLSNVFTLGASLGKPLAIPCPEQVASRKRAAAERRIVLLLLNAPELAITPFVSPLQHVKSIALFNDIPAHLRSKLLVALRTRPGVHSEDPFIYHRLSSLPEESISFLSGLTLEDSIAAADCVVGVNLATSGYFEVLERGVPLLHLEMAAVTTRHPDLPEAVVPRLKTPDEFWKMLEAVIFDDEFRTAFLARQKQFVDLDLTPDFTFQTTPLQTVLSNLQANTAAWQRITQGMLSLPGSYFKALTRALTTRSTSDSSIPGNKGSESIRP